MLCLWACRIRRDFSSIAALRVSAFGAPDFACIWLVNCAWTEGDKTRSFTGQRRRSEHGSEARLHSGLILSWPPPRSRRWFADSVPHLGFFDGSSADTDVSATQGEFWMLTTTGMKLWLSSGERNQEERSERVRSPFPHGVWRKRLSPSFRSAAQ